MSKIQGMCRVGEWPAFVLSSGLRVGQARSFYISGPMSGYAEHNYPVFHKAEEILAAAGYHTVNPARSFDGDATHPREDYMRLDIANVLKVDAVAILDGWGKSAGATLEVAIARAIGTPVYALRWSPGTVHLDLLADTQLSVLDEAKKLVYGDRGEDYGHPADDLGRTAQMWSILFNAPISTEQVALGMIMVKLSRLANTAARGKIHRDSVVDIAGYAEVIHRIQRRRRGLE